MRTNIQGGLGDGAADPGLENKIDLLIEEINQLWSFVQRFIDEHATDMIQDVRSGDVGFKTKMNRMDWLARNSEFLSPDSITKCLLAFKEQFNGANLPARNNYITSKHTSTAVVTVVNLIDHVAKFNKDEENISRLAILLSLLEPLLINDLNLERGLEMRTMDLLVALIELPDYVKNASPNESIKLPIYIKYAARCITSCVRHPEGINQMILNNQGTNNILQLLSIIRDEEIIANSSKIVRIIYRDDKVSYLVLFCLMLCHI